MDLVSPALTRSKRRSRPNGIIDAETPKLNGISDEHYEVADEDKRKAAKLKACFLVYCDVLFVANIDYFVNLNLLFIFYIIVSFVSPFEVKIKFENFEIFYRRPHRQLLMLKK